jgi:hypothetical protein
MTPVFIDISPEEKVAVDIFRPGDATDVGELFRAVYGEDYPVKLVYEPEGLVGAFERQENIPTVARSSKGGLVGYVSLFRSAPSKTVYEGGQGLVRADYRKHGIARAMNRYFAEEVAPLYGVDAVFGEAVCNHPYMQKAWANEGAVETALEVDLMPAEAYAREGSARGRVASLHMTRDVPSRRPHRLRARTVRKGHTVHLCRYQYRGLCGKGREYSPRGKTHIHREPRL